MSATDALSFIGFVTMILFSIVGAYIVMRWGYTGILIIWQQRKTIDSLVAQDVRQTVVEDGD
jgi:hypothetical protein